MKLAEALRIKADYSHKLEQLKSRIESNCIVQDGEKPSEDPNLLLKQYEDLTQIDFELSLKINEANFKNKVSFPSNFENHNWNAIGDFKSDTVLSELVIGEKLLVQALSERVLLKSKIQSYRDILHSSKLNSNRYSNKEIKILATMDVRRLNRRIDVLSKFLRLLDVRIQEGNWTYDVDA